MGANKKLKSCCGPGAEWIVKVQKGGHQPLKSSQVGVGQMEKVNGSYDGGKRLLGKNLTGGGAV